MKRRFRSLWLGAATLFLAAATGCQSIPPLFGPQGNEEYQRRKATVFDPFTDSDMGPEVVGGRPRDYQKAAPEVDRSRWFRPPFMP